MDIGLLRKRAIGYRGGNQRRYSSAITPTSALETAMHNRIEWAKHAPEAYKAMVGLEQALARCGLENSLLELVRLRASQINGCAYCVNLHANDARNAGETEARLQTLCVWQETAYFTRVNGSTGLAREPYPPA